MPNIFLGKKNKFVIKNCHVFQVSDTFFAHLAEIQNVIKNVPETFQTYWQF
jgi:hypothetical protein